MNEHLGSRVPRGCVLATCLILANAVAVGIEIDPSVLSAQAERIKAIAEAKQSAVSIFVPSGAGGGSGVVISEDGFALTNFHVSSPAGAYMMCGMADGNIYDAVIVGIDPVGDLALIKLIGKSKFPAAELGDSNQVDQGDWCMVIGNPFLLADDLQPTVTWGIISGVHRYQYPSGTLLEYADCLQTDASINPGNSGGPLYGADSRLLGIVGRASFEKRGRVNVGVGYAISINQAKNFLGYLGSGRIVDHCTLGATVTTDEGKVVISNILESSDAYRRGLRYGAEILEISGRSVDSANAAQNVLGTIPKGWRIPVTYRYDGETSEVLVRTAGVHAEDELLNKMAASMPPPPPKPKQDENEEDRQKIQAAHGKEQELPEAINEIYEAKHGFANYYFNRLHQQRLFKALSDQSLSASSPWKIEGPTEDDGPTVEMQLGETPAISLNGDEPRTLDERQMLRAIEDQKIDGFSVCLSAWRRLLTAGLEEYGDVYFQGTAPLRGQWPLCDVLIATAGEIESRFYFHPETGRLQAIESWADRFSDPAEVLFEYSDGERPKSISLYYGMQLASRWKVNSWEADDE